MSSNMDITSILNAQSNMTTLLDMYMSLEEEPKIRLESQISALDEKSQVLSDLDSKLSALRSKSERLTDPITDYFQAKVATSSDTDKFTVEAANSSSLGNHTLTVQRLAQSDTRVSEVFMNVDSDFTSYTTDQTFSIEVGSPTDEDPDNRVSVSVTVTADKFTADNENVLYEIASAINTAMSAAVTNEDIVNDEVIRAAVIQEINGESRLQLRSNNSGYTYRMNFTDSADGLLNDLQVNRSVLQGGDRGGYMIDVGTSYADSNLNSQFTLNGLTYYRDANNVSDAMEGVTMRFLNTFETTETITITPDTEEVQGEVEAFIESYNETLRFLKDNVQINASTYERGVLADDTTYRSLRNEIRSMVLTSVPGVTNTSYSYLNNIGISSDDEGYLSISDIDEFTEALENNAVYVSDLFRDEDNGIAVKLDAYLENFVKATGTISQSQSLIDDRINILNDRLETVEDYLSRRREQLQSELEQLQESMSILSSQQNFFNLFMQNL